MSLSRLFTIVGDANVRRNMTGLNIASREVMKTAQVVACDSLSTLDSALIEVRKESSVCIIACLTGMLLTGDDTGTVSSSVESVLIAFKSKIDAFIAARPTVQVAVAPHLYRHQPFWYQRSLPQITGLFSVVLSNDVHPNLSLLASFSSQDLLPDGIYLTPVSGLHYVLHLFDCTETALRLKASPPDAQAFTVQEVGRQHDDRLVFLEQRHARLDARFDFKFAADAEFRDWMTNRSDEDWCTVTGAARLSPDLLPREWQRAVKKQMTELFKLVLTVTKNNVRFTVLYVVNPIRNRTTGQTVLNVRLDSAETARRLREIYSGFFGASAPVKLPASLKGISVWNKVTLQTRIRLEIMRQLGRIYQESNGPGSSFKVKGYDPRPLLITTPSSRAGGARQRTFNFIDAVRNLPATFSEEGLIKIYKVIGEHHQGELQSMFVVLRDDDRAHVEHLVRESRKSRPGSSFRPNPATTSPGVISGHFSGSGSGMEVSDHRLALLKLPPPPPPPLPSVDSPSTESPAVRSGDVRPRDRDSGSSHHDDRRRRRSSSTDRERSSKRHRSKKRHRSSSGERRRSSRRHKRNRRRSSSSSGTSTSSRSSRSGSGSASTRRRSRSRER